MVCSFPRPSPPFPLRSASDPLITPVLGSLRLILVQFLLFQFSRLRFACSPNRHGIGASVTLTATSLLKTVPPLFPFSFAALFFYCERFDPRSLMKPVARSCFFLGGGASLLPFPPHRFFFLPYLSLKTHGLIVALFISWRSVSRVTRPPPPRPQIPSLLILPHFGRLPP